MSDHEAWGAAPLSSVDWRFLLPAASGDARGRLAMLGASAAALDAARDAAVATIVEHRIDPGTRYDVIADLTGTLDARALDAALAHDGAAVLVVRRRGAGRGPAPEALRALLRVRGLAIAGVYAGVPDLARARALVPLDVRHAFRWYMEVLARAPSAFAVARERLLRAITGLDGVRVGRLVPEYLVIVTRAEDARADALATLGTDELPAGSRPLLVTAGRDRVTALPFSPDARAPLAVLKIPRSAAFDSRTEVEQATMAELRSRLPTTVRDALPAPLGVTRRRALLVARESPVPGRTLLRTSGSWGTVDAARAADLRLAAEWITGFHRSTEVRRPVLSMERTRWLEAPVEAYERAFGATAEESVLFARMLGRASELGREPLPVVTRHGDYSVWNVLRAGTEIFVVDWEGAREGLALLDLLHLVTGWHEAARGALSNAQKLRRFRALFLHAGPATRACASAREELARYMRAMSMSPRLLPLLLVHARIELALGVAAQRRDAGMPMDVTSARRSNPAIPFVELLARHADELLERWDHAGDVP